MSKKDMPIEKSHIMMFARSIGDPNPIYYDEDHANNSDVGSIIAPPTFTQASAQFDPDYFLRPKIDGKGWFGSGKANYQDKTFIRWREGATYFGDNYLQRSACAYFG